MAARGGHLAGGDGAGQGQQAADEAGDFADHADAPDLFGGCGGEGIDPALRLVQALDDEGGGVGIQGIGALAQHHFIVQQAAHGVLHRGGDAAVVVAANFSQDAFVQAIGDRRQAIGQFDHLLHAGQAAAGTMGGLGGGVLGLGGWGGLGAGGIGGLGLHSAVLRGVRIRRAGLVV